MWKVIAISIEIVGARTLLAMAAMSDVHNAKRASASSRIVYSVSGLEARTKNFSIRSINPHNL